MWAVNQHTNFQLSRTSDSDRTAGSSLDEYTDLHLPLEGYRSSGGSMGIGWKLDVRTQYLPVMAAVSLIAFYVFGREPRECVLSRPPAQDARAAFLNQSVGIGVTPFRETERRPSHCAARAVGRFTVADAFVGSTSLVAGGLFV
ncbi:hypothetical protein EVAR_52716_1 [Eumeta japonica]|uniref:Uncharacterized protein n=1 Tax=Eumeta variegata TaxID=151549 RepID=A0A4C1ZEU7_EUMVA|nr:hypothetical protein EVAR_52716_1 [Eumeta japonica]